MEETREGDLYTIRQPTRRSFEQFRRGASLALLQGFSGLLTTQRWEGHTCHVNAFGSSSKVSYEEGWITCKVSINSFLAKLFKEKILSDVRAITLDVSGLPAGSNKNVFIVHGHSYQSRDELESFLKKCGLRPIILQNEDDRGLTIVEKFEHYATGCSFAFILMTPDDAGGSKKNDDVQSRARQNVILELGWFMAHLGRERVAIIYQGDLEIPSDISGVLYLRFENSISEVMPQIVQRLSSQDLLG